MNDDKEFSFHELIQSCIVEEMGIEEDMSSVFLRPGMVLKLSRKRCSVIKERFIEEMKKIPDIEKGLSYIEMAGYNMGQGDALI